ncbi:hypothetical protein G6F68_016025 [Rhizopus microsporus]|nr:hypothetical protein G6F68_016025 [Rhizopus microsporus]
MAHRIDRGISHRKVGCDPGVESLGSVPCNGGGTAAHEAAGRRAHHQHRVGAWPGGLGQQVGLCGRQARRGGLHQGHGAGNRRPGHYGQLHLPGLGPHPAGGKEDHRAG